ncbi:CBS domain-containing protein [Stella sp.]|uniref:CBS domain-containing protein n=1 Tax=Stella sp. TaxID=2912054 RepID=UPI0035B4C460
MNVRDCMTTEVHLCAPGDSVRDAANAMRSADAGSIPVGENDRLVGMITDRDIALRVVGDGLDPETPVRDVMSDEILYCFDDETVEDVARQMADLQVRRMPVVNREKRLVGIVSLGDLAQGSTTAGQAALRGVSAPGGAHRQH